ncbi:MAG: TIGR04282 family arsenosugar biosynthesis glycosyltransferase [Pseudomonadota bacterium]
MKRAHILIYAKPPRMGLAKTRLARSLRSPAQAQRIARMSLARTMRAVQAEQWVPVLYTAPDTALSDTLGGIWPPHLKRRSQGEGDLTARLTKGLAEAPPGPVLFIGADAPDLSPALLNRAIRNLQSHDAVFGPASDGGFWLFGLNKTAHTRSPFHNVRWSTEHALGDVRANLPANSRIAYLPTLIDIDEADDWHAWRTSRRSVDKP